MIDSSSIYVYFVVRENMNELLSLGISATKKNTLKTDPTSLFMWPATAL
jgi:hypothetical protein